MLKLNKSHFSSKENIESQIEKYKDWYFARVNEVKKPSTISIIIDIVENNTPWSFVNKTSQEIREESTLKEVADLKLVYADDFGKWLNEVVRPLRNSLLLATDSPYFLSDYNISDKELSELNTYRSNLRDITKGLTYTAEVTFPTVPTFLNE